MLVDRAVVRSLRTREANEATRLTSRGGACKKTLWVCGTSDRATHQFSRHAVSCRSCRRCDGLSHTRCCSLSRALALDSHAGPVPTGID